MFEKREKNLIKLITYTPTIIIIVATLLMITLYYFDYKKVKNENKQKIEQEYIKEQKLLIKNTIDNVYNFLEKTSNETERELKEELKLHIDNGYSIINNIYKNSIQLNLTKKQTIQQIKSALKDFYFFNNRAYYFVYESNGKNILNPAFPELEGKNLWNYKDAKGKYLLQEMKNILSNKDSAYYSWYWNKPDDKTNSYKKLGYFKKFEPYDWFIGMGEYLDDFTNLKKLNTFNAIRKYRYGIDNYIYIIDKNKNMLVNKYAQLENTSLKEDKKFKELSEKIDKLQENNNDKEGLYVKYNFKHNNTHNHKKISYLREFRKWGIIIGTGFNLEEIQSEINERQETIEEIFKKRINEILIISCIFQIILVVISIIVSNKIKNLFNIYRNDIKNETKRLKRAQKVANLGDWKLNLDTKESYMSNQMLKIIGFKSRPENIGIEYIKSIMYKEDKACFEDAFNKLFEKEHKYETIYRIKALDGKIKWIECKAQLKPNNIVIGTFQDITERKELELEKEQKEKIIYQQSKMATMGEMIGNIAHQWRQPLTSISTASTSVKLQNELKTLNEEYLIKAMDSINNSAQYLSQTIDDFRNFFSPKNNQYTHFNIKDTFEKTFKLISAQYETRQIQIIKDIKDIEINSLQNELIQVLINILNNARDALEKDIEEKLIFIETLKEDDYLHIKIKDNAGGISYEIIDKIFQPYFTTKDKSKGTGIGLHMSKEIVEKLLNGTIKAENITYTFKDKDYKGALFIIAIPFDEVQ